MNSKRLVRTVKAVSRSQTEQQALDRRAAADPLEGIRQGLHDVELGNVRPLREFLKEFRAQHSIQR